MGINQKNLNYGQAKSAIREIAGFAARRRAEIGADNVFDFSIGNPSVPAPSAVKASIEHALTLPPQAVHSYTAAIGTPATREAVAASLWRRHRNGVRCHYDLRSCRFRFNGASGSR